MKIRRGGGGQRGIDLVVSELISRRPMGLASAVRKQTWEGSRWVVLTRRRACTDAQRAFDLGALDFVAKPAPTEVPVAVEDAPRREDVHRHRAAYQDRCADGAARHRADPFHGRKSGNLKIRSGSDSGEIHIQGGEIWNALFGSLRGEEAFYAMLRLQDGEFGLDPQFTSQSRVIHQSSEALLLEGMRRLDEGIG